MASDSDYEKELAAMTLTDISNSEWNWTLGENIYFLSKLDEYWEEDHGVMWKNIKSEYLPPRTQAALKEHYSVLLVHLGINTHYMRHFLISSFASKQAEYMDSQRDQVTGQLNDDFWEIKKALAGRDIEKKGNKFGMSKAQAKIVCSTLLITEELAKKANWIWVWDTNTRSMHSLKFKLSGSEYVFSSHWLEQFVYRRGLRKDAQVAFHLGSYQDTHAFLFSTL